MRRLRAIGRLRTALPHTLRGRLALLALVSATAWVAALTIAFDIVLAGRLSSQAAEVLRTRAAAVAATVEARPDGGIVVHEPPDDRALDVGTWIYRGSTAVERPSAPPPSSGRPTGSPAGAADTRSPAGGTPPGSTPCRCASATARRAPLSSPSPSTRTAAAPAPPSPVRRSSGCCSWSGCTCSPAPSSAGPCARSPR